MADNPYRDTEIAALRTEVAELRDLVTALGKELRRAQQHVDLTMRGQLRCRACGCRRIAHAMSVLDRGESNSREAMSLYKPSIWWSRTVGELEAYICTKCGAVEWWVKDPGSLEEHEQFMRIVEGDTPEAPYR